MDRKIMYSIGILVVVTVLYLMFSVLRAPVGS